MNQNFAIIPARGGSRRIPGKNIREFHGRPIIAYSIATALDSLLFHHVVVSTDSVKVAEVARQYGALVLFRPPALAEDDVGTQRVVSYVSSLLCISRDLVCTIYPTAPLMTIDDLARGMDRFVKSEKPWLYTVGPDNQDAGQWYMGYAKSYWDDVPLDEGAHYKLPAERVCDINTEEDWQRALQMYEAMV